MKYDLTMPTRPEVVTNLREVRKSEELNERFGLEEAALLAKACRCFGLTTEEVTHILGISFHIVFEDGEIKEEYR